MREGSGRTCIVLAGGLGTRLRSAIADLPKCLAPVGDRSFLDIQLDTLYAAGIDDVVLSLGYKAEAVLSAISARPPVVAVRHVVEPVPLGTGGAIAHAMDAFSLDEVLVANGDTFLDGDIGAMLKPLDRAGGELMRMAVVSVPDRARFGGVAVDGRQMVSGFLEKGEHGAGPINAGLYRLCRQALPPARKGSYSLEADVLPGLVTRHAVSASPIRGSFIDIGVPQDYFRFRELHAG
jgi:D-glycero-alpha-D-manno-heptose 1-phosphate guanylyltransferase